MSDIEIDIHLKNKLDNKEIPLGEILKEKGFISVSQLEEGLEYSQDNDVSLGVALLKLKFINQSQLKIALEDQAAIKKVQKKKSNKRRRLGDILMAAGTLTEEQLSGALEFSVAHGVRIGQALVQLGIVTEDELAQCVGEQLMIPYIKLSKTPPDPLVLDQVTSKMSEKHLVMPVKQEGGNLYLAMVDPQNILVIDDIEKSTGLKIVPMIVAEKDFKASFEAFYGEAAQAGNLIEMIDGEDDQSMEALAEADFDEDSAPIKNLMNKVVTNAVKIGASDIHIEPFEHDIVMRFRVDGMMRPGPGPFPVKVAAPISSRIKVMSGLDISETRQPQDGKFRMSLKGKVVDVRVSTCPTSWGEKIVMRILDQSGSRLRLADLGIDPENMESLTNGLEAPNGIILVTGPTGSGKTTTLYSSLVSLNKPSVNIQTAEDPVEYDLPGIAQCQCTPEIGMTFAKVLKAFLRQDPDIILIGEIRDQETAETALKAALTGHLVLSTLHTNSSVESIGRLSNMGIDRFLITSAVRCILAQRLMRRICPECKETLRISKKNILSTGINDRLMQFEAMKNYNISKLGFYKAVGCKTCNNIGYKGRMGIHEVMNMTENMARGVNQELSVAELKMIAKEDGMMNLRDCALMRAIEGKSTIEEVDRLTINEDKMGASDMDTGLVDEIMIRSGSWKLSSKELLQRKKKSLFVPGDTGTLDPFFIDSDLLAVEAELRKLEESDDGEAETTSSGGGGVVNPAVFEDILSEIRSFGKSSSSGVDTKAVLQSTKRSLKGLQGASPDKIQSLASRLFVKLDSHLELIKYHQDELQLVKKKVPLNQAISKDIYGRIPKIAAKLSKKLGKKVDVKKIKFSKSLDQSKFFIPADWPQLKLAFELVLENHLEALISGGGLKVKSKLIKSKTSESLEVIFHDNSPQNKTSYKNEVISAGFTSKKGHLGLGLSVAEKLLAAHNAKLEIQVLAGKGCQTKLIFSKK
ncbi:MAG: Flp pilus assembly complex ATPase component TadA [Candidatus Cloacimonetes bacterium]|nr:Flp pilus assembly complex ATPase component TadA [Candidatus Cloacimonadota bacterium]